MDGCEDDERINASGVAVRSARREAILQLIKARSGDSKLSAAVAARLLGITPRYVHLLLVETGQSFTHHLLQARLETAAALLRDPQQQDRRIATVAGAAGFNDLSYFNRTFRRRYNATPSGFRAAMRRDE